jgi:hypothetical protein
MHRRDNIRKKREFRMAMQLENAAAAIGEIAPGCEIFGLTKGDFSLISVLEHLLGQTGPADVMISTWTAAAVDIQAATRFLEDKRIRSIQFLVDQSFRTRQPEYCARLVEAFGPGAIRFSRCHCKFVTIVNDRWALAYRRYSMDYVAAENTAREARRGIWKGKFIAPWDWRRGKRLAATNTPPGTCPIKGNISRRGERIYHMPGGQFYTHTKISPSKGERWFCTEAEAKTAGWRRSRR